MRNGERQIPSSQERGSWRCSQKRGSPLLVELQVVGILLLRRRFDALESELPIKQQAPWIGHARNVNRKEVAAPFTPESAGPTIGKAIFVNEAKDTIRADATDAFAIRSGTVSVRVRTLKGKDVTALLLRDGDRNTDVLRLLTAVKLIAANQILDVLRCWRCETPGFTTSTITTCPDRRQCDQHALNDATMGICAHTPSEDYTSTDG